MMLQVRAKSSFTESVRSLVNLAVHHQLCNNPQPKLLHPVSYNQCKLTTNQLFRSNKCPQLMQVSQRKQMLPGLSKSASNPPKSVKIRNLAVAPTIWNSLRSILALLTYSPHTICNSSNHNSNNTSNLVFTSLKSASGDHSQKQILSW